MKIHTLVPECYVQGLVVEFESLHGAAAKPTAGGSTTYRATVKDDTGSCTLIYRQGPQCNPASIRKGNTHAVTGQVVWEQGHIVLEASAVNKTHKHATFSNMTDPSYIFNLSSPQHLHAILLLRHHHQQQWQVLLSSTTCTKSSSTATLSAGTTAVLNHGSGIADHKPQVHVLPKTLAPVPVGFVTGALSDPAAASRVLDQALQLQNPGDYQLLPLPAAAFVWGSNDNGISSGSNSSSSRIIVHLYAAVLQQRTAAAVGRELGRWLPVQDVLQQQQQQQQQNLLPSEWSTAVQLLLENSLALLGNNSSSSDSNSVMPADQRTGNAAATAAAGCTADKHGPVEANLEQQQQQQQVTGKLPVTLLSGFLGAGKTTLLKHLLRNAGDLRIAVVVNDVAALNIDSALVKSGGFIKSEEELVELQNGCICCSLRLDLVKAIAKLAAAGRFDLLLLESTGVSEPLQVAEIFSADVAADVAADGPAAAAAAAVFLRDVAYLDTAVTVVDAHQLMNNLHSIHTFRSELSTQSGTPAAAAAAAAAAATSQLSGGHRHIAELLLDQIEVADVLVLNKADTVSRQQLQLLQTVLTALNPTARLITTANSVVNPREVLQTGLWSVEKAQGSPAWVQLLRSQETNIGQDRSDHRVYDHDHHHHQQQQQQQTDQSQDHPHDHDYDGSCCCTSRSQQQQSVAAAAAAAARSTAAYGVSHFVYRARWPFHPRRLHDFMTNFFVLQQPDWKVLMGDQDPDQADQDLDQTSDNSSISNIGSSSGSSDEYEEISADLSTIEEEDEVLDIPHPTAAAAAAGDGSSKSLDQLQTAAAARREAFESRYGMLLRSKGFVWVASRGDHIGEWSQAGSLISFSTGGPWFCVLPPDAWPEDDQQAAEIRADFVPPFGDRRQELVFIGVGLREPELRSALDSCLVTVEEAESSGFSNLEDPFEPWPHVNDMIDAGEPSDHENDDDEEESEIGSDEQQQQQQLTQVNASAAAAAECEGPSACCAAAAAAGSYALWQPGQVAVITEGAAELQQLFNSLHNQCSSSSSSSGAAAAAVVHWLAPWAEASQAAESQLTSLAKAFPHLPVISVNVTVSDANKQLALEKVMHVPQSYRKGGRKFQPVPKSGHKWPCVTLHDIPLLHPVQEFSGAAAGQQLMEVLQGQELMFKQQQQQRDVQKVAAEIGRSAAGQQQQQQGVAAAANDTVDQQQQQQQVVHQLTKGATDLKLLLQKVQPADLLLLLWSDGSSSSSVELCNALTPLMQQFTDKHNGSNNSSSSSSTDLLCGRQVVVATADAAATAANKALAAALKVTSVPVLQVYHNRQVIKAVKLSGVETAAAAAAKVQAAVMQLQLLPLPPAQQQQGQQEVASSTAAGSSSGISSSATADDSSSSSATANASSSSSSSIWDPPTGKSAKPGSKRKFPTSAVYTAASSSSSSSKKPISKSRSAAAAATVAAVFWPRMPCLNCGCPWWLGEDWDAACARCGWTCENDGYDDDSNVLPEYKDRYMMICEVLKQGRTPVDLEPLEQLE